MLFKLCLLSVAAIALGRSVGEPVRVPVSEAGEVDVGEVVARLAERAGLTIARPEETLTLPARGLAGSLTRTLLAESLGPDVALTFGDRELIARIDAGALGAEGPSRLEARLSDLADRARKAARKRLDYGMHARASYRPNDPSRPTVCLVHGLNSSAAVFRHMVGPLEAAGFGVVAYDYPFNRDLHRTAPAFARDWLDFRRTACETRPWAVVSHSMGALLVRWYVEGGDYAGDVSDLVMVAPPNQGSGLAGAQAILQLVQGVRAVKDREARALAHLADGLGEAADDLTTGSEFLKSLNRLPRRARVRYHVLAGDAAVLSPAARRQVEALTHPGGLLGNLTRRVAGDLSARLDELTDGLGDGCVAVAATRLDGVDDHRTIHADHLELIRAPFLYPDPGPVACLPFVLERLGAPPTAKP